MAPCVVYTLMLLCCALLTGPAHGAVLANTEALVQNLFANYSEDIRPFDDSSQPLNVYLGLWLTSIQELNEIDQSLTFSAILYVEWTDNRLVWDPNSYNKTDVLTYPQKKLWTPDITISNSVQTMGQLGFDRNYMYVENDGMLVWYPSGTFKTSCDIDVTYYPFDTQSCKIIFSTLTSTLSEINIDADNIHSVQLDQYSPSGSWDLVNVRTSFIDDTSSRTKVSFEVKLKRLTSYYVVSIIIPILFLSLTATLVFALPADSGEKMGTAITVLLAFAVYLTIVSEQMPKTSLTVSVLSLYLSTLLGQTALGVVLSVWILNLHFRDEQDRPGPGRWTRAVAIFMKRLTCKRPWREQVRPISMNKEKTISNSLDPKPEDKTDKTLKVRSITADFMPESSADPDTMTWKEISFTFDRFLFYIFTIFLIVSSVIYLGILIIGGAENS